MTLDDTVDATVASTIEPPEPTLEEVQSSRGRRAGRWLAMLPIGSSIILFVLFFVAIFAPLLAPHDPIRAVEGQFTYSPPIWQEGGSWSTPLGTDFNGRDVFSRLIYGARVSVIVGLTGTAVAGAIGILMGVLAGFFGGWVDGVIMRVVDAWLAIPTLVLAMLLAIVLRPSMWTIVLILGVVYWTRYARILRGEVLTLRERDFVKLSEVAGASGRRIIIRHVVPNIMNTWLVLASLTVGVVIVAEASLSFLGVGVPPPDPAWGSMLSESRSQFLTGRWWLLAGPALCIGLTVLACNLFGDWLRVRLDPQQRNL